MKFKRRMAFAGKVDEHDVLIVKGEFTESLLVVDNRVIGWVKPEHLQEVIEFETTKEEKTNVDT